MTIVGLATDYCVKNTALDALKEGFGVNVDHSAVRGVDVHAGDSERALASCATRGRPSRDAMAATERLLAQLRPHVADARVLDAMRAVPRDRFVAAGQRAEAWENARCRSAAGRRSPSRSSSPACASCCACTAGDRCSTSARARATTPPCSRGWRARLLDRGPPPLADAAAAALHADGVANVTVVVGDGSRGLPRHAPFDAINVAAAAADEVPHALLEQQQMN